jgi:predicted nuclease with TOPRIM domain
MTIKGYSALALNNEQLQKDYDTLQEKFQKLWFENENLKKDKDLENLLRIQWEQNYFIKNKNIELEDKIHDLQNQIIKWQESIKELDNQIQNYKNTYKDDLK